MIDNRSHSNDGRRHGVEVTEPPVVASERSREELELSVIMSQISKHRITLTGKTNAQVIVGAHSDSIMSSQQNTTDVPVENYDLVNGKISKVRLYTWGWRLNHREMIVGAESKAVRPCCTASTSHSAYVSIRHVRVYPPYNLSGYSIGPQHLSASTLVSTTSDHSVRSHHAPISSSF
jgi:hypothetical protein